jgi:hypothetical protein
MVYAQGTKVTVEASLQELKRLLKKHGATSIGTYEDDAQSVITFTINGLTIKQSVLSPDAQDYRWTASGTMRSDMGQRDAIDAELRRRWRVLVIYLKAKLTAIDEGITTIEREFLADVTRYDGSTVGEAIIPRLKQIVLTDKESLSIAIALSERAGE